MISRAARAVFLGLLAATIFLPESALANDRGPVAAIAAIRHDLPLLLASSLESTHLKPTVDWVVADDSNAVAAWHAGQNEGVVVLRLRSGHWWWRAAAVSTAGDVGIWTPMAVPGNALSLCYHDDELTHGPPSAHQLFAEGFIDKGLAGELSTHLFTAPSRNLVPLVLCDPSMYYIRSYQGAYTATLFHKEDVGWQWFVLDGHTPPVGYEPATQGVEAYYLFDLAVQFSQEPTAPETVAFASGSTFEVWFPFVLQGNKKYTLHLDGVSPEISALPGSLKGNVLRFVLPSFVLRTEATARGEIDGELLDRTIPACGH
ncbi:MAG TPA: hypothetical protein VJP76_04830 [Candidatus Tumulicola sp.]|nr:hypothetical protein [Candidatus Tumulicola sp.]